MEHLENRLAPAVRVWDGGALFNDNWTDNRNWDGNVAPAAGDELHFPASVGSLDKGTFNDFAANTRFLKLVVEDGYALDGHSIIVGDNVPGSSNLATIETSGNVSISLLSIRPFDRPGLTDNLSFDVTGGSLNVSSRISGDNLLIGGAGTMTMSGSLSNDYTGSTTAGGKLVLAKPAGVTAIPGNLEVLSPITVFNSNQIADSSQITLRSTIRFEGVAETLGNISLGNGSPALDLAPNSVVTTGSITEPNNVESPFTINLGASSRLSAGSITLVTPIGASHFFLGQNSFLDTGATTLKFGSTVDLAEGSVFSPGFLTLKGGTEFTGLGALGSEGQRQVRTSGRLLPS